MDGLTWLIMSWLIVGILCYFMLAKVGTSQTTVTTGINDTTIKSRATSSKWINDQYSIDWLNDIIGWLFNNMHRVPDTLQAWIIAMNEAAKKISIPGKFEVLFEGFSDNRNVTRAPRVTDIRLQQSPNDHLIMKGKISIPEVNLKLMSSQRTGDRLLVTSFDAKIIDLHGEIELHLACIANQIYMMACFCGRPELDIELVNRDPAPTGTVSNTMVDEMIRKCLLSAVTNVSLTEPGGQCGRMATNNVFAIIPRAMTTNIGGSETFDRTDNLATVPTHEMMKRINQSTVPQTVSNKMRVNVIRAQRLGGDRTINQSYVVLEMDEPAQKFQTKYGLNISPYWEESFDFDLTPASEEILFEIYEGSSSDTSFNAPTEYVGYSGQKEHEDHRFLGLAIVSLDEVRHSSANILHTLKLQGRPYRNDIITGNLTVQFDFYYDPMGNSIGKNLDQTIVRNSANQFREIVNSSTTRPVYDPRDSFGAYDNHDMTTTNTTTVTVKNVSQQSLNDKSQPLVSGITTVQQTSTTPMAYDSLYEQRIDVSDMQQQQHSYDITVQQQSSGLNERQGYQQASNATTVGMQEHVIPGSSTTSIQHFITGTKDRHIIDTDNYPYYRYDEQEAEVLIKTEAEEVSQTKEINEMRQSRDQVKTRSEEKTVRKRDRSFFNELRERLSGRRRSKRRAKSCEPGGGDMEETVSLPPSRDISRTRFSEKSGSRHDLGSSCDKSEHSIKSLYQHSTLLLETHENGQKRYYLIPHAVLDEPGATKLLRQGKKLHVHNGHTFVAVKSRSGTTCNVCHQRIGRSNFTKQAYQCRDCYTVCHKPCHYKTESYCTTSNVDKLNITKDIDWEYLLTNNQIDEFISEDGV
ncbi:Phorbol esters/diacylglycerol binding domain (C1 domain) family protein [Brugia pahangi]